MEVQIERGTALGTPALLLESGQRNATLQEASSQFERTPSENVFEAYENARELKFGEISW